jgi:hypothetical protein
VAFVDIIEIVSIDVNSSLARRWFTGPPAAREAGDRS